MTVSNRADGIEVEAEVAVQRLIPVSGTRLNVRLYGTGNRGG